MNFDSGTAYAESDADDEYERSLHSPVLATDSEISPTDSEGRSSTEHTPTTYGHRSSADRLPETIITEWTAEECADFVATIGLEQYSDRFLENEIVGEALVALLHDDLKSMGVTSVGHRLTILKSVYDVKKAQDIPIESDHYVPQSAEAEAQYATATLKDIKHLVEQLRLRDERMSLVEQDLRRLTDDYRRLREDMLPALRLAKNAQQPLPNVSARENQGYSYESATISPPAPTPSSIQSSGGGLKRQYSTKKIVLGTTPKNASPSYMQTTHERPSVEQTLDPASAAEKGRPLLLTSRRHERFWPSHVAGLFSQHTVTYFTPHNGQYSRFKVFIGQTSQPHTPGSGSSSVEIFKSFRVSMDDPCYKVLPAALRKYQINAPWDQYALYIVYGDQERCLGLDEKPLILFKQLDKEGKKPMFMLRKTNTATADTDAPGSAGLSSTNARGVAYDPPGGII
ncbi:SAM domain-containing protein [Apiospora arundinis]